MAWGRLCLQPASVLTPWDQRRFGHGSSRRRRSGIVDLARQRLMALWRFVETGVLPDGAALKAAVRVSTRRGFMGCETGLRWAAREKAGFAPWTDLEQGRPAPGLHRRRERMLDPVFGRDDTDTARRSFEAGAPHAL